LLITALLKSLKNVIKNVEGEEELLQATKNARVSDKWKYWLLNESKQE